jgi:exonuclease III
MLIEEKKHQLKSVIELEADIICGDFNTKLSNSPSPSTPPNVFSLKSNGTHSKETETLPNITDELIKYAKTFYKNDSAPENLEDLVKKWLFMDEYHALLSSYDYNSVYTEYPENETSAYGGVVDFIYYKRNRLSVVGEATIVNSVLGEYVPDIAVSPGKDKVKRENLQGLKYVNGLSDHAPVKATFNLK